MGRRPSCQHGSFFQACASFFLLLGSHSGSLAFLPLPSHKLRTPGRAGRTFRPKKAGSRTLPLGEECHRRGGRPGRELGLARVWSHNNACSQTPTQSPEMPHGRGGGQNPGGTGVALLPPILIPKCGKASSKQVCLFLESNLLVAISQALSETSLYPPFDTCLVLFVVVPFNCPIFAPSFGLQTGSVTREIW